MEIARNRHHLGADSIAFVTRANALADSMVTAGADSTALAQIRTAITTGDLRSLFRGGFGRGGRGDTARPGETPPSAPGEAGGDAQSLGRDLWSKLRREGGAVGRGMQVVSGGGFGGPSIPPAAPGNYTVHITVNGQTFTQPLEVVRAPDYAEDLTAAN